MGEILWIISYVVLGLAIIPFLILTLSVEGKPTIEWLDNNRFILKSNSTH